MMSQARAASSAREMASIESAAAGTAIGTPPCSADDSFSVTG